MILVIDNYDSFTYNLVQYLGEMGHELCVVRNDQMTLGEIRALNPAQIVISPGPGTPDDGGVSLDVIRELGAATPILGVCLGHQSIGQAYGGIVKRARQLMHGKTSQIRHDGEGLFAGVPNPFTATRYHSLIVEPETLPDSLIPTAYTTDDEGDSGRPEIMALRHREHPVFGVQFHPESILTESGMQILRNFIALSERTEIA